MIDARQTHANHNLLSPQIEQSFRQLPISLVVNLVNGLILVAVLWWGGIAPPVLLSWLLFLLFVTGARFLTMRTFAKAARSERGNHVVWERYFVTGACASGLVWGASGIFLLHPDSFPLQVFLAFMIGGMVAGALPLLSSVRYAYWCFTVPAVVPICIHMVYLNDGVHLIMGLLIAVFAVAMLSSSLRVRRLFRDSEDLRSELVSSLELSHTLEHLVRMDTLTQIPNRRLFEEELRKEWGRAEREGEVLAVILIDIDHFKEYNDHYGHPSGDQCLIDVAQAMQAALSRPGDVVARIGGEEFAILLPNTTLEGARAVAEQLQKVILGMGLPHEASPVSGQVTLSFGVASSGEAMVSSPSELVRAADTALYEAKHNGRNRIEACKSNTGNP